MNDPCKSCGSCASHVRCCDCGNCRVCGKPIQATPAVNPPWYPTQPHPPITVEPTWIYNPGPMCGAGTIQAVGLRVGDQPGACGEAIWSVWKTEAGGGGGVAGVFAFGGEDYPVVFTNNTRSWS